MRKVVLLLVLVAVVAGVYFVAFPKPRHHTWKTEAVLQGELIVKVNATGTVEPQQTVMVGSQASGAITDVFVEENQVVAVGQKLAAIETDVLESDLRNQESLLKKSQSDLDQLALQNEKLAIRDERLDIDIRQQQVALERAQINLKQADIDMERFRKMFESSATSQNEVDLRALDQANKRCECRQLELQLAALKSDRKALQPEVKIISAQREQAQLALAQVGEEIKKARTNLAHASILSPLAGVVLKRYAKPGQTVAAVFQTPDLFEIASDLRLVNIQAKVDEANIGRVQAGQTVTFEVDAYHNRVFTGTVKEVRLKNEKDANLVSYPVMIEASNPTTPGQPFGPLRPGMTAYVNLEIERKKNVLRLPAAALRYVPATDVRPKTQPGESDASAPGVSATVYVPSGETLQAVSVRVGDTDGKYYEVLSGGLSVGANVVLSEQP